METCIKCRKLIAGQTSLRQYKAKEWRFMIKLDFKSGIVISQKNPEIGISRYL